MKKSDLIRIIREVVKREVKSAIKEELGTAKIRTKIKNTGQYSSNPALNEVLQETATEAWPTMGNKTLTSADAPAGKTGLAAVMGMESPDQMFGGKPTVSQMLPDNRKHVEVEPEIEKALTRDYSQLMKAMDKKKQNK